MTVAPQVLGRFKYPGVDGGLLTTALSMAGVWWLAHNADDFNVMNWSAWFILPIRPLRGG